MKIIIHTDGGSRGNPGPAASAFVVLSEDGSEIYKEGFFLGVKTNNDAEYSAFLFSLKWVGEQLKKTQEESTDKAASSKLQIDSITWKLDSMLVVEQLNKHWKIKEPRMKEMANSIWSELAKLRIPYKIGYVPRAQNAAPDALVNETLDATTTI